jgi:hypothetical protein
MRLAGLPKTSSLVLYGKLATDQSDLVAIGNNTTIFFTYDLCNSQMING